MSKKKLLKKRLLLVGIALFLGLLTAEIVLRVAAGVEARRIPGKSYKDTPADGVLRLAVLGGSTANGFPYSMSAKPASGERFNLLSATALLLQQEGGRAVEIDNYSGPNWSAETAIDHYLERPGHRPDLLVLYTGQNETTRYYTPNMNPPPRILAPLARLKTGDLLLRRLFTAQVTPADQRYTGTFFSDNIIPRYERKHNLARYLNSVGSLIRHAQSEKIPLVVVIPQGNLLFPPTRSVYRGPANRKEEALTLFKQAWRARHIEDNPDRAKELLVELLGFCSFAHLFYELGELHYVRGEYDVAIPYLQNARESDGFPVCITPAYREALKHLVQESGVPHIDMNEVICVKLERPVPDYQSFLDDCHLYPDIYLALSREIIREAGLDSPATVSRNDQLTLETYLEKLGITQVTWLNVLYQEADYHFKQAGYAFLKLPALRKAHEYLLGIKGQKPVAVPPDVAAAAALTESEIRAESMRMTEWIAHEGPMPLGALPTGEVPEGFGGGVDIEASQGDAMAARGEYELAAKHYRAALKVDPEQASLYGNLGAALCNLGRFEEAIDVFERGLDRDPQNLNIRSNLGRALATLRRFDEAVVHLGAAVRMSPGNAALQREYEAVRQAASRPADPDATGPATP